jgi:hypothetical protein
MSILWRAFRDCNMGYPRLFLTRRKRDTAIFRTALQAEDSHNKGYEEFWQIVCVSDEVHTTTGEEGAGA